MSRAAAVQASARGRRLTRRWPPAAGHMAFSFLVLAPVALRQPWETHRRTLEKQWRGAPGWRVRCPPVWLRAALPPSRARMWHCPPAPRRNSAAACSQPLSLAAGIATISACMALNIALNNISLLDVSLTLNQIIRCAPCRGLACRSLMAAPRWWLWGRPCRAGGGRCAPMEAARMCADGSGARLQARARPARAAASLRG